MTTDTPIPTSAELAESNAICAAATPGPLRAFTNHPERPEACWIAVQGEDFEYEIVRIMPAGRFADADFFCHARDALPQRNAQLAAALERIVELEAELENRKKFGWEKRNAD